MSPLTATSAPAQPVTGSYFVATYPPFSYWSADATNAWSETLVRPWTLTSDVPLGLYIHIPFCERRCDYCYYLAYADQNGRQIDTYLDALLAELGRLSRVPALVGRLPTFVYVGGGTPSLLSAPRIRRLMAGLRRYFSFDRMREVTYECAPRSVTPTRAVELRSAGVTRISLGVQQLDDEVLSLNGRVHRVADVERALNVLRNVDFDYVNTDLMVGLVGESDRSFDRSLEHLIGLAPDSVTIYQLEIPHNTPLYRAWCEDETATEVASWKIKHERLERGFARLERAGYHLRSAYTAVRDPKRHEFVYQDAQYRGADLLGLGAASFSYLAGVHHQNLAALRPYVESLAKGDFPFGRAYVLNDEERLVRELVLQLKLGSLDTEAFRAKFGIDITRRFAEPLGRFAELGWLEVDQDRVTLTRPGLLRVDRMIPAFYLPRHRDVGFT